MCKRWYHIKKTNPQSSVRSLPRRICKKNTRDYFLICSMLGKWGEARSGLSTEHHFTCPNEELRGGKSWKQVKEVRNHKQWQCRVTLQYKQEQRMIYPAWGCWGMLCSADSWTESLRMNTGFTRRQRRTGKNVKGNCHMQVHGMWKHEACVLGKADCKENKST